MNAFQDKDLSSFFFHVCLVVEIKLHELNDTNEFFISERYLAVSSAWLAALMYGLPTYHSPAEISSAKGVLIATDRAGLLLELQIVLLAGLCHL